MSTRWTEFLIGCRPGRTAHASAKRVSFSFLPRGACRVRPEFQTRVGYLATLEAIVGKRESAVRLGEVIQETWRRELGVVSTIATKESRTFFQSQRIIDFSIANAAWVADFADPATFFEVFLGKGGNNQTGWANPEYDRLIAEAARTLDPERRFEYFQQAEALLLEEAPIAPLYFETATYLIHPVVKGWMPAPLFFRRYQNVWLEK